MTVRKQQYLNAFLCGGVLCAVGQVLLDRTKLTPARILVCYVTAGVLLGGLGLYAPLVEWAGAGATSFPPPASASPWPRGVRKAVSQHGLLGALTGGFRYRGRDHRRHLLRLSGGPPLPRKAQTLNTGQANKIRPAGQDRRGAIACQRTPVLKTRGLAFYH
ncbi:MAG: SpoVA/SpoVAEb family sporulation membrane protein [Lawsonibacter sp.]